MLKSRIQSIRLGLCICLAFCAAVWSGHAKAVIGAVDHVPAATLLLPYFEVDLSNPNGSQTTVRVTNTSASALLAHAVLYTDLGVPTMQFNFYLTGFDSVDIDMRLLFNGIIPQTASAGQDPSDRISPKGAKSQDINFASCTGVLPPPGLPPTSGGSFPLNGAWNSGTLAAIRAAHTGQASTLWSGQCGGVAHGDNVARGYMTIDSIVACSQLTPADPIYFLSFNPLDTRDILAGSSNAINRSAGTVVTENLVSVEASSSDPQVNTVGVPSFYGRFLTGGNLDRREALGAQWSVRYMQAGATPNNFSRTQVVVWRDPGVAVSPFACGGALPAPFPLVDRGVEAFDEQEHPVVVADTHVFPYATQLVDIAPLTPFASGVMYMDLDASSIVFRQSYVSTRHTSATGKVVGALPGQLMATVTQLYCQANATPPPAGSPFGTPSTPAPGCAGVASPQGFGDFGYFP